VACRRQTLTSLAHPKNSLVMRVMQLLIIGPSVLIACGGGGGAESSVDTLPKRGERATDPTIVSATAGCTGDLMFKGLVVQIDASDPAPSNLGSCAATFGADMGQGMFSASGRCTVELTRDCGVGTDYVVDLTISNKTGGVTVASVKLHAGP
jgi:hypothetical protein